MTAARPHLVISAAFLLLAGCFGDTAWPPVALSESDRNAAESDLYPRFLVVHDMIAERPETLDQRLGQHAKALSALIPDTPQLHIEITNEADADAGCLAGGWIFLSRGLVSRIEHDDELAGIIALAATQCGRASRDWRRREELALPPLTPDNWLMQRYRDFRVEAGVPLYRTLVRAGCGTENDCHARAHEWLQGTAGSSAGLRRLLERIASQWPNAAVLERFGDPDASTIELDTATPTPDNQALATELSGFRELRTGFDHLREAWRQIIDGEVRAAYRANIAAFRETDQHWVTRLMQARLDLINMHPFYSERRIRELKAERPDYPYYGYWEAWIDLQSKRWSRGIEQAAESLEYLPRADLHFLLGRILEFRRRPDEARPHYRAAIAAGEIHPDADEARVRLQALEP